MIAPFRNNEPKITQSDNGDINNMAAFVPNATTWLWADYTIQNGSLHGLKFGGGMRYIGFAYSGPTTTNKGSSLGEALSRMGRGGPDTFWRACRRGAANLAEGTQARLLDAATISCAILCPSSTPFRTHAGCEKAC